MGLLRQPDDLSEKEIEEIEKVSLRALFLAAVDFGFDAALVFFQSQDDPKDVAEDTTREMLDRMSGYRIEQRIFGNVDYRKARYMILPDFAVCQALFVDSKAEKDDTSATLQMSQVSLIVRQKRGGMDVEEPGLLKPIDQFGGSQYLSTVLLAHYFYQDSHTIAFDRRDGHDHPPYTLFQLTLAAIPNGRLQDIYNSNADDHIWKAGRNSPKRNEPFRVRLDFQRLQNKASWRVQRITYDHEKKSITAKWRD